MWENRSEFVSTAAKGLADDRQVKPAGLFYASNWRAWRRPEHLGRFGVPIAAERDQEGGYECGVDRGVVSTSR